MKREMSTFATTKFYKHTMYKLTLTGAILLVSVLASAIEVSDTSRVIDLDEVIVTSQPKESRLLRQQPLSSTVITQRQMQQLGIGDLSALSQYVPAFSMPQYGSRLTSSIYVRGIGSRVNNPAVGIYYDNIPLMDKSAFNHHFYMVDRVDVLRGPQGTLYGKNTEGGLVRIYTKNPMDYQGTDVNLGIGTVFYRKVELAHYRRVSEQMAFSVAAFYNGQNGFFKNRWLDERNDRGNEAGSKVRLTWKPSQKLTLNVTSDYQFTDQNGFPYGLYDVESKETAEPSTTFTNNYRRQMVNSALNISCHTGNLLLTSTTSHQYLWDRMNMDQDYVSADYLRLMQQQKMNAVTQELVLRSHGDGHWQHATGVFGSYEWLHTLGPVDFGEAMGTFVMSQWGIPAAQHDFMKFQNYHIPGDFHTPQANLAVYHESDLSLTSRARLTLGLRYDYSWVKIDYDTKAMFNLDINMQTGGRAMQSNHSFISEFGSSMSDSYHQLLPKFGLTIDVGQSGGNVYAVASKGFRAGGYNLQMFSDIFQTEAKGLGHALRTMMTDDYDAQHTPEQVEAVNNTISYKPETSWNFEAGAHLNLLGQRLKADIAVFYSVIRNQQLSVMAGNYGFGRAMVNAGKSYSCGLELSVRGGAMDNRLTWGANYSFTNARFREYDDLDNDGNTISYKDNYVPFIPLHKFSATADYVIPLSNPVLRNLTLGANITGQGKTYWEADNQVSQSLYALLGAHAALDFGAVVIDIWGRNLTNTDYNTFLVYSKLTEQYFAQRGNRIQAGIDARIRIKK